MPSPLSIKIHNFDPEFDPEPVPKVFRWSDEQQEIIDWVPNGQGNLLVEALAGTGKTSTAFGMMEKMQGSVDYVVFGKKNEIEARAKLIQAKEEGRIGPKTMVGTFHSFGLQAWRRVAPNLKIEGLDEKSAGYYKWDRIQAIMNGEEEGPLLDSPRHIKPQLKKFVKKLVSMAKQRALGLDNRKVEFNDWASIINDYAMDEDLCDEFGSSSGEDLAIEGMDLAQVALTISIKLSREIVDFDDMIYMALFTNCRVWQNDYVLADEAQDMNPARRMLAKKMVRPFYGRSIFIGDRYQAILRFTGADNDSMDIIKRDFKCQELPLTVTYRCPKVVVGVAQQWVPHYKAHETAPDGTYKTIGLEEFDKIASFSAEDSIICRNNAPLVSLAFTLIRRGIPCYVEGRDIGKEIMNLAGRWKIANLKKLIERVAEYKRKEVAKLEGQNRNGAADTMADRCDTLLALIQGMPHGASVQDLHQRISTMFQDTQASHTRKCVVLCSIHKSKGLEWKRVYLYGREAYMPSRYAKSKEDIEQEWHLAYVAVTRAMNELIEVSLSKKGAGNEVPERGKPDGSKETIEVEGL